VIPHGMRVPVVVRLQTAIYSYYPVPLSFLPPFVLQKEPLGKSDTGVNRSHVLSQPVTQPTVSKD